MGTTIRILAAVGLALLLAGADVRAQGTPAVRERVYRQLAEAQAAVEAEDWDKAFDRLGDVEKIRDLEPYERAQLWTAYGYAHYARGDYDESVAAYEKVLALPDLPAALTASTRYTLAQLSFQREDYAAAAMRLEQWLDAAENPGPEPWALLGQAYYQLGRVADAVAPVERAVAVAEERGRQPRETWYVLLRVFFHELGDRARLLETLEILVTRFPSEEYWLHLAAAYGEAGDETRRLAAYEAAFAQGYLDDGRQRLLLAQLRLQADLPWSAAELLSETLESGSLDDDPRHWRLLSQAWTAAHEHERAVTALQRAAALSDDGELDARLAQSHALLDAWDDAVAAARSALDKGVEDAHEMHLLIGMALYELGRGEEARAAFAEARRSEAGRAAAVRWLEHIEREDARRREMARSFD